METSARAFKDLIYRSMGKAKYASGGVATKAKNAILDMPTGAGTGTYHSLTPREMISKVKGR